MIRAFVNLNLLIIIMKLPAKIFFPEIQFSLCLFSIYFNFHRNLAEGTCLPISGFKTCIFCEMTIISTVR